MANNRMYLRCTVCDGDDCRFLLAKYYPSSGWDNFIPITREIRDKAQLAAMKPQDLGPAISELLDRYWDFNRWLDRHRHYPETNFAIEYESGSPATAETGGVE